MIQTSWFLIKQYINKHKPGDIITRQDMVKSGIRRSSVDGYRVQLYSAGILCKHTRGKYKIISNIPEKMTTTLLYELWSYYNVKSWKNWFIPLEDKIKKLRPNFYED